MGSFRLDMSGRMEYKTGYPGSTLNLFQDWCLRPHPLNMGALVEFYKDILPTQYHR